MGLGFEQRRVVSVSYFPESVYLYSLYHGYTTFGIRYIALNFARSICHSRTFHTSSSMGLFYNPILTSLIGTLRVGPLKKY